MYIKFGGELALKTGKDSGSNMNISNKTSLGAIENSRKVMTTLNSFGLVQEGTLRENSFMREHLNYVTPLYMERMHIIYDHKEFERKSIEFKKVSGETEEIPEIPTLSTKSAPYTDHFFMTSKINKGPVGSGTQVFASYLLDHAGYGRMDDQSLTFSQGLTRLKGEKTEENKKVDIIFFIGGAPIDEITQVLDERFRLMSIDSAMVPTMNKHFDLKLEAT
jgi:TRAP-type uncharacterized transport system substrate-binding protein